MKTNKKIYFSGSLYGVRHKDPEFSYKLVKHLQNKGYKVLSEHVAGRTLDEVRDIHYKNTGIDLRSPSVKEPWSHTYNIDMAWVDEAGYLIAVIDGPSHGVGMEIMRALLKEERGLNKTQILCLVHKKNLNKSSWIIRGVPKKYTNFSLKSYSDLNSALEVIDNFLTLKS